MGLVAPRLKHPLDHFARITASPIISFCVLSLLATIHVLTNIRGVLGIYSIVFIFSIFTFFYKQYHRDLEQMIPALLVITVSLLITFVVVVRGDYLYDLPNIGYSLDNQEPIADTGYTGYDADSLTPWRLGRVYLQKLPLDSPNTQTFLHGALFFERTPLLPLATATFMNTFGQGHFVYQRFLEVLAAIFYLSLFYFIFTYTQNKHLSKVIFLLILINVPLSMMGYNIEVYYKYFASYPIFLSLAIINSNYRKHHPFIMASLSGIAFLIHPYTILLTAGVLIFVSSSSKFNRKTFKVILPTIVTLLILLILWIIIPKTAVFTKLAVENQSLYIKDVTTAEGDIISTKIINFVQLFIPNPLKKSIYPNSPLIESQYRFQFFRYSIISNLSPVYFPYIKNISHKKKSSQPRLYFSSIPPLILFWLIYLNQYHQRFDYGGTYFLLFHFSVPLLITFLLTEYQSRPLPTQLLLVSGYIIWMIILLLNLADPFTTPLQYNTHTVELFSISLYVIFVALCICTIALVYKTTKK